MKHVSITIEGHRSPISWTFIGIIVLVASLQMLGCGGPQLKPWHTERLTAEFTAEKLDEVQTFDDYRQLEQRLFAQLEEKVYTRVETGPENKLVRYSTASAADPQHRAPNWNRSFELGCDSPVGGVLLLHGMSDSPYSLRSLAETLNQLDYWIVVPRLPGHGTAPSGLKSIKWEDMAAVVRLGIEHLATKVGSNPIHIVGYSTGAALALNYTLEVLEGKTSPMPSSLVLISPAIGIHAAAGLAGLINGLSIVPGLGGLAWLSVQPEFDPYKYNSLATNAGSQVHRVTRSVGGRLAAWVRSGRLENFPSTLVFQSTVDATVSTGAVVDRLLKHLGPHGHELVLFDINRQTAKATLLISDPGPQTARLMSDDTLPFTITLVTNEDPESAQVIAQHKNPFSETYSETFPLNMRWPIEVISLSHLALPFAPDDPLYGRRPPHNEEVLFLGQMAIQGERGLLKISYDWLVRLRHNPFYDFLEDRTVEWMEKADEQR